MRNNILSLVVLVLLIGLISCEKNDDIELDGKTTSPSQEVVVGSSLELRSLQWHDLPYVEFIGRLYRTRGCQKLSDNRFKFVVELLPYGTSNFSQQELYVKFYHNSTGTQFYQKMRNVSPPHQLPKFELEQSFLRTGDYSYRYLVRENVFTNDLRQLTAKGSTFFSLTIPSGLDDYHAKARKIYAGAAYGYMDQWNFGYEECVSWVALKVNQMWGTNTEFNNRMFGAPIGSAKYWKKRFQEKGYSVNRYPRAGDIIWWSRGGYGAGHVGFVHEVTNGTIRYTEYNGSIPHGYSYRELSTSQLGDAEFIHIQRKL